ncbi:MAG: NADAR family protein [Geitlerinemataceae cyanobacterium]
MTIHFYKADRPYGCFSNFSPHCVQLAGRSWQTAEHYYQAHKFFGSDRALFDRIHAAPTPERAAAIGRANPDAVRADWAQAKIDVMYTVLRDKFQRHRDAREVLLGTGDRPLIEDSPVDYFWGCGADGTGANHLGLLLMQVREELRQTSPIRPLADRVSP